MFFYNNVRLDTVTNLRCVPLDKPECVPVCLAVTPARLPEDFKRTPSLGFYFVVKIICGGFGFPCLMSWGSQPGGHCLLIFCAVIFCIPFRPQLRPLDHRWPPGTVHVLIHEDRKGRYAGKQRWPKISSERSHTCNVNSPLEDCHVFYFKIPCPLCHSAAASYFAV